MNAACGAFERWLDAGRPAAEAAVHAAHAAACPRCAALLALESALAAPPVASPAPGFAGAVMRRVRAQAAAAGVRAPGVAPARSTPRRAAAQTPWRAALFAPAAALAFTALALPFAGGGRLGSAVLAPFAALAEPLRAALVALGSRGPASSGATAAAHEGLFAFAAPLVARGTADPLFAALAIVGLLPLLLGLSWGLYRWTEAATACAAARLAGDRSCAFVGAR